MQGQEKMEVEGADQIQDSTQEQKVDEEWFVKENKWLAAEYGEDIILAAPMKTMPGNLGYTCRLCYVVMNSRALTEKHCQGGHHIQVVEMFEQLKEKGISVNASDDEAVVLDLPSSAEDEDEMMTEGEEGQEKTELPIYTQEQLQEMYNKEKESLNKDFGSGVVSLAFENYHGFFIYTCKLCFVVMKSKKTLDIHCSGTKHAKKKSMQETIKDNGILQDNHNLSLIFMTEYLKKQKDKVSDLEAAEGEGDGEGESAEGEKKDEKGASQNLQLDKNGVPRKPVWTDNLDEEWYKKENERLGKVYGLDIITVTYGKFGYRCKICGVTMNSNKMLDPHTSGSRHVNLKKLAVANRGGQPSTAPVSSNPVKVMAAGGKVKESEKGKEPQTAGRSVAWGDEHNEEWFKKENQRLDKLYGQGVFTVKPEKYGYTCVLCNVHMNSSRVLDEHCRGNKHKQKFVNKSLQGVRGSSSGGVGAVGVNSGAVGGKGVIKGSGGIVGVNSGVGKGVTKVGGGVGVNWVSVGRGVNSVGVKVNSVGVKVNSVSGKGVLKAGVGVGAKVVSVGKGVNSGGKVGVNSGGGVGGGVKRSVVNEANNNKKRKLNNNSNQTKTKSHRLKEKDQRWLKALLQKLNKVYGEGIVTLAPCAQKGRFSYYCEPCATSCTSKQQLNSHCSGQKHLKKLKLWTNQKTVEGGSKDFKVGCGGKSGLASQLPDQPWAPEEKKYWLMRQEKWKQEQQKQLDEQQQRQLREQEYNAEHERQMVQSLYQFQPSGGPPLAPTTASQPPPPHYRSLLPLPQPQHSGNLYAPSFNQQGRDRPVDGFNLQNRSSMPGMGPSGGHLVTREDELNYQRELSRRIQEHRQKEQGARPHHTSPQRPPPSQNFNAPPQNFNAPPQNFNAPPQNINAPPQNFNAPPHSFPIPLQPPPPPPPPQSIQSIASTLDMEGLTEGRMGRILQKLAGHVVKTDVDAHLATEVVVMLVGLLKSYHTSIGNDRFASILHRSGMNLNILKTLMK